MAAPIPTAAVVVMSLAAGAVLAGGCKRSPEIRTDAAPLRARVKLPAELGEVRWISRSTPDDGGCVPGPTYLVTITAYLAVPAASWPSLSAPGGDRTVTLPDEAMAILPADLRRATLTGPVIRLEPLVADVQIRQAIRVGDGLLVQLDVVDD